MRVMVVSLLPFEGHDRSEGSWTLWTLRAEVALAGESQGIG